ncbi:sialic acid-binding periplasmic protein SiaP precursor [Peptococcaceae bacterium CEB3]|nr:sialic acid-binding periplasmic protein SiaP precursor [Peptococcaceae bacterium CEB3]
MRSKNIKTLALTGGMILMSGLLLITGCGQQSSPKSSSTGQNQSGPSMVLKFGELNPKGHPIVQGMQKFADLVKEKTNGRITVQLYPGGTLGNENTEMQSLQMGALDLYRANSMTLADFGVKQMAVFSLPYIFSSNEQMWKVLDGSIGQQLLQDVNHANLKMRALAYYGIGSRDLFSSKKPIRTVGDLKGLKVRVPQDEVMMAMVKDLGASPTPTDYNELYSALQSGVVDAAENDPASYMSMSFYEVGKYLTLDQHTDAPGVVLMSQKTWNKLSASDRKIIQESALESSQYERNVDHKAEQAALTAAQAKGVTVIPVPDKTPWQKAMAPLYVKYAQYQTLIDQIRNTK